MMDTLGWLWVGLGAGLAHVGLWRLARLDSIVAADVAWLRLMFEPSEDDEKIARAAATLMAWLYVLAGSLILVLQW